MRALVIFESMFGCTEAVARAVARGIGERMSTDVVDVGGAPAEVPEDVGLLVLAAPTHAFGLSREQTRADARSRPGARPGATSAGVREWLATPAAIPPGTVVAACDTRVRRPRVSGSAARAAARRLRRLGVELLEPPRSFWVEGMTGPLSEGELVRAQRWGAQLGAAAVGRALADRTGGG